MSDPRDSSESTSWPAEPGADAPDPSSSDESCAAVEEPEWPAELPEDLPQRTEPSTPESTENPGDGLVCCTVVCRGELAAARVLRDSFLRHHPGARFVILLLDTPDSLDQHERTEVRTPEDVGVDSVEFGRLAMACDKAMLRAVLLPRLLRALLDEQPLVVHAGPVVEVFDRLDHLLTELREDTPLALAPRVLRPIPADGLRPSARDLAEAGSFDPNFLAVHSGAQRFLAEWAHRVRAEPDSAEGFVEGLPAMVDHRVLRDPGLGVSVFNVGQRTVRGGANDPYQVDGHPLRTVVFDGFDPQRPWLLSADYADRPRVLLSEHPSMARLCANHRNALVAAGFPQERAHPFEVLSDGTLLTPTLRATYRRSWLHAEATGGQVVPSPYEPASESGEVEPEAAFIEWAGKPADDAHPHAGGSRWTAAVWADDPVLRRDYPEPSGADAAAFHEWCAGAGVASRRIPGAIVRENDRHATPMVDQLGVAVVGTGRLAASVRQAVRASGLPTADTPQYPVVLRCAGSAPVPGGHHVVDIRPDGVVERGGNEPAELWVLSQSGRHAARHAGRQARVLNPPLPEQPERDTPQRKGARARLELSDEFVIAAFADHSDEHHTNVLGLVAAFTAAFDGRDDVALAVAVEGADEYPEAAERLRLATTTDPRILLLEDDDAEAVVPAAGDCVASLHRTASGAGGDRFALLLLEAAARGIPVITGELGAVAEIFGTSGAMLIRCQGSGEPATDDAAAMLRRAADSPDDTARFGLAAREYLSREHSTTRAGEQLRERVEQAYRNWRAKWARDQQDRESDPLHPLLVARHALHRPPEVGMGGRNAVTPALRRAVLKALGHYDEHIRDIIRSLLDGMEKTAGELLRRQQERADELDTNAVRAELTQLAQRQEQLSTRISGADDGMATARTDLAEHERRLRALEESTATNASGQVAELAERIESLTGAVERTLDRVDRLEKRVEESTRFQEELASGLRRTNLDTGHTMRSVDALCRVVVREHERVTAEEPGTPVVCDAGLLRLPADDTVMLPWLSAYARWDADVSELIDSLIPPGGVFVDVGAHAGYQAIRVLSGMDEAGRVVAVEPDAAVRRLLTHNVDVNVDAAKRARLTVLDCAAWDIDDADAPEAVASDGEQTGRNGPTRTARLEDELARVDGIERSEISVIHLGLAGRVDRVLRGLDGLLREHRPSVVCTFTPEVIRSSGEEPASVLREFEARGYDLVPVGRTESVSPEHLLEAIGVTGGSSAVKLWLRPLAIQ